MPQYYGAMTTDENGLDVPSSLNSSSLSDFSNDGKEAGYNLAAFRGGDIASNSGSELGPAGFLEHSESVVLSPGTYHYYIYAIGRLVRATVTLYPIGRPVRITITLYPIMLPRLLFRPFMVSGHLKLIAMRRLLFVHIKIS